MQKSSNSMGCLGSMIFLLLFVGVGIGLSLWGWSVLQKARVSESWPQAQGEIVSSEVRRSDDENGSSYSGDVTFEYVVADSRYSSDNVSFGQYSGNRSHAEEIVAKYPVGSRVTVYYDPEDVATAVLEPGVTWSSYLLIGMGVLFTCIPIIIMPFTLLRRR